mgnify:CR=1 FL=1
MIKTLTELATDNFYKELGKGYTKLVPLFVWYTYQHHYYLLQFMIHDILSMMNKSKKLNDFEALYPQILSFFKNSIDRDTIIYSLSNSINVPYLKCNFFEKLLLFDLVDQKLVYKKFNGKLFFNKLSNYELGKPIISSNFKQNFYTYTQNAFDGFNWSNVIIAGGLVNKIINPNFEENLVKGFYDNSDIDMYLYGHTKTKKKKLEYILNFLNDKLGAYYLINFPNVITLIFPNYHCDIQIIIGNYKSPLQIVSDFDLSHLQMIYNGHSVKGTKFNLDALETQTTKIMKHKITEKLATKTFMADYSMEHSDIITTNMFYRINKNINSLKLIFDNYYVPKNSLFFRKKEKELYVNITSNICFQSKLKNIPKNYIHYKRWYIDHTFIDLLTINYSANFSNSNHFYN